ncbi:response regulator [Candidatus Bathyarchaeota archaeon]|nr:response regulator [Candidatus Bathyarchaeota archaeon]
MKYNNDRICTTNKGGQNLCRKISQGDRRVLIVDDEPFMTETLHDLLKELDFQVTTANNGLDAINLIKSIPIDVAILDIKMPEMNGFEVFKKMKEIKPKTKYALMTGYAVEEIINEAIRSGIKKIFYKPLDLEGLVRFIQENNNS